MALGTCPATVSFSSPTMPQPTGTYPALWGSPGKECQLTDGPLCFPQGPDQASALLWRGSVASPIPDPSS